MKGFKTFTLFIVLFSAFILTGCGGGGGGGGTTPTPTAQTLSGTAAQGAPIANATVELKDSQGVTDNTTTDDNGKYSVTVTMTAPILLKVTTGDKTYYSIATTEGTTNIHPFTDLIIKNWYKVRGKNVDTEFSSQGAPSAVPTKQEIDTIESVVREILSDFLIATGIDPSQFNLITSPFNANQTGFDRVIDVVKVQYDDQSGNVTVVPVDPENNTPGEPLAEIGSNEPISSIPDMKTAINAGLSEFKNTVNSKGCTLQTSDIQPYLEQDFLWRGMNADIFTDDIVLKVSYLAVMRTILKTDR